MIDSEFGLEIETHRSGLKSYAMRLARNVAAADDLVQEVMAKALAKEHQFAPGTSLRAWLFTIMRNEFYRQGRKAGHFAAVEDADAILAFMPARDDQAAALEAKDALAHLFELPTHHRDALLMCADGVSYEDIARHEGVEVGTIKSRISRGREQFQQSLRRQPSRLMRAYRTPQTR